MKKLGGCICDNCRRIIQPSKIITKRGKKRQLHFCSNFCLNKFESKKKKLDK